jgi:hypothetical protein
MTDHQAKKFSVGLTSDWDFCTKLGPFRYTSLGTGEQASTLRKYENWVPWFFNLNVIVFWLLGRFCRHCEYYKNWSNECLCDTVLVKDH